MTDEDEEEDFHGPKPWPLWVALGLWGLPGRGWVWAFCWLSLLIAIAGPVVAVVYDFWPAFVSLGFVFVAFWYSAAIRWVDRNGEWP